MTQGPTLMTHMLNFVHALNTNRHSVKRQHCGMLLSLKTIIQIHTIHHVIKSIPQLSKKLSSIEEMGDSKGFLFLGSGNRHLESTAKNNLSYSRIKTSSRINLLCSNNIPVHDFVRKLWLKRHNQEAQGSLWGRRVLNLDCCYMFWAPE